MEQEFPLGLQEFCNTRKRLINKEKMRFLTLTRAKQFGGTTAFHITNVRRISRGEGREGFSLPLEEHERRK